MSWVDSSVTTGSGTDALALSTVFSFNYAFHTSQVSLGYHSGRRSVTVDLVTAASTEDTQTASNRKMHGAVQLAVWGFVVPLSVLFKRFGPLVCAGMVGGFPIPFVLHALLMTAAVVATVASAGLALAKFDGVAKYGHKETGITVLSASLLQVVMQGVKPAAESPHRGMFRLVHVVLAFVTMLLSYTTILTGTKSFEEVYPEDESFAKQVRKVLIAMVIVFVLSMVGLQVVSHLKRKQPEKQPEPALPTDQEEELGKK